MVRSPGDGAQTRARQANGSRAYRDELDADGCVYFDFFAGPREPAGVAVDLEYHDVVGQLVCGEQICAGGINLEIARHDPAAVDLFDRGQRTVSRVDGKHSDTLRASYEFALSAAVGFVEKFSVRVNLKLAAVIAAEKVVRHGCGRAELRSACLLRDPRHRRQRFRSSR